MAALNVRHTPVRLMSTTSMKFCSSSSQKRPQHDTPALATTTSIRPKFVEGVGDRGVEVGLAPDVADAGDDPASGRFDQGDRLHQVVLGGGVVADGGGLGAEVEGDDGGPFRSQTQRMAAALTPCRPSDEADLSFQRTAHDVLPRPGATLLGIAGGERTRGRVEVSRPRAAPGIRPWRSATSARW